MTDDGHGPVRRALLIAEPWLLGAVLVGPFLLDALIRVTGWLR